MGLCYSRMLGGDGVERGKDLSVVCLDMFGWELDGNVDPMIYLVHIRRN
jgi:hypothetical protein